MCCCNKLIHPYEWSRVVKNSQRWNNFANFSAKWFFISRYRTDWGQPSISQQKWTEFCSEQMLRRKSLPVEPQKKVTHFKMAWVIKLSTYSQRCMWGFVPSSYDVMMPVTLFLKCGDRLSVNVSRKLHSDTVSYRKRRRGSSCISLQNAKFGVTFQPFLL